MIELCYFSLDQWDIKIHLLWGKCFNIPHWPRSHSTNYRRLQHIEKLSKTYSGDPHLDQTKLNGLMLLTIHGVLGRAVDCSLNHILSSQVLPSGQHTIKHNVDFFQKKVGKGTQKHRICRDGPDWVKRQSSFECLVAHYLVQHHFDQQLLLFLCFS